MFEDGSIYKVTDSLESPASISYSSQGKKYKVVSVTENGKQKHFYVHRLVALAFIPNPNNYPQVNHIDGNTKNNAVSNLEWVTAKMNTQHAYRTGLIDPYSQGKTCSACGKKIGNGSSLPYCRDCFILHMKSLRKDKKRYDKTLLDGIAGKDLEIMEMWADGKTYREIGNRFGFSRQRAHQIVQAIQEILNLPDVQNQDTA